MHSLPEAAALATGGTTSDEAPSLAVSTRALALPYLVVPFAWLVVAADKLVLQGTVTKFAPRMPDALPFFTLIFNAPHIVASFVSLADVGYLRHYRRLFAATLGGLIVFTLLAERLWGAGALGLAAALATTFHLAAQQLGIAAMQLRAGGRLTLAWKWLSLGSGMSSMLLVVDGSGLLGRAGFWLAALSLSGVVVALPLAFVLHARATNASARRYLWANQALFATMSVTALFGYPILSWLTIRVVHDLTAFYVYSVHDSNRNRTDAPNLVFRELRRLRLSPRVGGPLLALALAFLLERVAPPRVTLFAAYWLSGLHYVLETFIWRGPSLHRRHTPFR